MSLLIMNMTSNMLGPNAATLGLKAMLELDKLNKTGYTKRDVLSGDDTGVAVRLGMVAVS